MCSSNPKILFITHLYYPSVGGAERVFQRIAEGLAKKGHCVTVLTSDALSTEQYFTHPENRLLEREIIHGVSVHRESLNSFIYKILRFADAPLKRLGRAGVFIRPLSFGPHFQRKFIPILNREFDVIIAGPTPTSVIFYGLVYKKKHPRTKLAIFPHMHTKDKLHTSFVNFWVIRKADLVFALTEAEKRYLIERKVKKEKIKRIVNAVDDEILFAELCEDRETNDYVLYLGQEGEHKRIPLLLEAMKSIWERGFNIRLVIAGARTNFSATIDRLIAGLPIRYKSQVLRFNNISEAQKVKLLDNCLVLVNPSSLEAFGLVFLEAWARKKPVIGAEIPAIKEIVKSNVNGLLFQDKKKGDLEAKILLVMNNRILAEKMGKSGYEEVKTKYVWERVVRTVEGCLFNPAIVSGNE